MYFILEHPIQKIELLKQLKKVGEKYGSEVQEVPVHFDDKGVHTWRGN